MMTGGHLSLPEEKLLNSPFANVYWFSRYLINGDSYGSVGCQKPEMLHTMVSNIEKAVLLDSDPSVTLDVCKRYIHKDLSGAFKAGSKKAMLAKNLEEKLSSEINSLDDLKALIIAIRFVVLPINDLLKEIPSDDKEFVTNFATAYLQKKGDSAIAELIKLWDELGVKGCIDIERAKVTNGYKELLNKLASSYESLSIDEKSLIATAYVQEFERRSGQKRKTRGGTSLEDLLSFIFQCFKLRSCNKPEHFQQDMEVDKWFKCKDGWIIGISCKRTLRERWKQLSGATSEQLSRYKIREIWHIITYDTDLSDDKVVLLGGKRQIFYLSDSSPTYHRLATNKGTKEYVRPLNQLVCDIKKEISGQAS